MSRPIAESLSLLSETLGNCKTNLKEKEVADVDNIKISDVDEKIAEIKSGGGSEPSAKVISFKVNETENVNAKYPTLPKTGNTIEIITDTNIYSARLLFIKFSATDDATVDNIRINPKNGDYKNYIGTFSGTIKVAADNSDYGLILFGSNNGAEQEILYFTNRYVWGE